MRSLAILYLGRLIIVLGAAASITIVAVYGPYGFVVVLVGLGVAGYVTEWYVQRREARALSQDFVPEHRMTLGDGTSAVNLEGEQAVRPTPRSLLQAGRYSAAWRSRSEAIVRVAPPLLRAVTLDVAGLVLGFALFSLLVVVLAARL